MILNPTPLQWKALQECVVVHRNMLAQSEKDGDGEGDGNENSNSVSGDDMKTATIDAAPLIAIIDQATSTNVSKVKPPFSPFREGGRYATLAAVVGIIPGRGQGDEDESSFLDYMDTCNVMVDDNYNYGIDGGLGAVTSIAPLSSTVRLVGVGRAALRKFFYRVPTELCKEITEGEGEAIEEEEEWSDFTMFLDEDDIMLLDNDDDTDDEDEYINHIMETNAGYDDNTPIVMSAFEPLCDDASVYSLADPNKVGEKGQRSYRSSPVHALSALNNISIKVNWAHDDRRKLVDGIKAAKARYELNQARRRGEVDYDDGLYDVDGLGSLFGGDGDGDSSTTATTRTTEKNAMTVDEFLATFKGNMMRIDPSELPQNQPSAMELMEQMENYGLSYYGSLSSISKLTNIATSQLSPYYSDQFREREEYDLEVSSFVAFRALEGFAVEEDMVWSLHCTSSIERLNRAYEIILDHTIQLKKLAEKLNDDLRDCGEECTDLW